MESKRVAILDLDSICFAIFNPNKVLDESGNPLKEDGKFVYQEKTEQEIIDSAEFIMNDILLGCECTHYIGYIKGGGNFRYGIKADYKANRPKESPKWWNFVKQYLMDKWNAVLVHNYEVDDAVYTAKEKVPDSFIVAIDQDLLALGGDHYNWKTKKWICTESGEAEHKFWSDMVCGQTGDNIKGIPGKGKVFFEKLYTEIISRAAVPYAGVILDEYISYFGEQEGIKEFYQNYNCLKLVKVPDLLIPEPVEFKFKENERQNTES